MKTKSPSRFIGLRQSIFLVLTDEWQTSSLIASQITFPPDAVRRRIENMKLWSSIVLSEAGARSNIVGQVLYNMYKRGNVERRKVNGNKYEFRLVNKSA